VPELSEGQIGKPCGHVITILLQAVPACVADHVLDSELNLAVGAVEELAGALVVLAVEGCGEDPGDVNGLAEGVLLAVPGALEEVDLEDAHL
jgi:hypothetical protein